MNIDSLRLELLRLTYTHGRDPAEAVGRAKVLEGYVNEPIDRPVLGLPKKADKGETSG